VLVIVHLLIALHIVHYLNAGTTLSPVEPSEAMYTLELGSVNAGFLAFMLMLGGTALFGRFFCGWGCHLLAIQDFSLFALRRLGIKPLPFRSNLLIWIPTIVAAYMFVWPTIWRFIQGKGLLPPRGFHFALSTNNFWGTFPQMGMALLTFAICGTVAVAFLGPKGFCTYGCPYGAVFARISRAAPLRIVVNDSCEQCGHCTATCTSNVQVHREVRDFGMVVDSNCMKCLDCISVCPKNALHLGLAASAPGRHRKVRAKSTRDLSLAEEALGGLLGFVTILALRDLYDGPPLLLSVAIGAVTAFMAIHAGRIFSRESCGLQGFHLKKQGHFTRSGIAFLIAITLWMIFVGHSGFVQWQRFQGRSFLDRTEVTWEQLQRNSDLPTTTSLAHRQNLARSNEAFAAADRWGLAGVVEIKLGLAWCALLNGDFDKAEQFLLAAQSLHPGLPSLEKRLDEFYQWRKRIHSFDRPNET
jgi:polyferredoxin